MTRVSLTPEEESPKPRKYVAKRDYGTRRYEGSKKLLSFGDVRATLYKRADVERGSWSMRFYLRSEKRAYRRSLGTTDYQEARHKAQTEIIQILARVQSGQTILSPSLRDVALEFEKEQSRAVHGGELAHRTHIMQRYRLNLGLDFLRSKLPAGDQTKMSAIDGKVFEDYLRWRQELRAAKQEGGTIRRDVVRDELLVIRKMFKFAHAKRLCSETSVPSWSFAVEKQGPQRERMTRKNYTDFINCIRTWRYKAKDAKDRYHRELLRHFVLVVSNTGLRSGELFGLLNRDVEVHKDAGECVINIRPETSKVRRGRQIVLLATPTSPKPLNYLIRWIDDFQRHKEPADHVFARYNAGKKSARDAYYDSYRSLRKELKSVGLEWFDTYHCRHFWITNRLLAEEPIHLVAKAAGTSTAEIEATYSHVLTELATRRFGKKQVVYQADGSYVVEQTENEPERSRGSKSRPTT